MRDLIDAYGDSEANDFDHWLSGSTVVVDVLQMA
jgi:hypothetical protein